MAITTIITATHVATRATKFDHIKLTGSRRQIRVAIKRLAAEEGRRDVWAGWNWDGGRCAPFAFKDGQRRK